jgi:hypothetical protein
MQAVENITSKAVLCRCHYHSWGLSMSEEVPEKDLCLKIERVCLVMVLVYKFFFDFLIFFSVFVEATKI